MTDAALLHLILCGSTLYIDLLCMCRDCVERFAHMKWSVHLLNTPLQVSVTALLNSTLLAVALLVGFEARTLSSSFLPTPSTYNKLFILCI
jgi:hypothetical protein